MQAARPDRVAKENRVTYLNCSTWFDRRMWHRCRDVLQQPLLCCQGDETELRHPVAEGRSASRAWADHAQLLVAVNASIVAVGEVDLDSVAAYRGGGLRPSFGLEHREHRRCRGKGNGGGRSTGVCSACLFAF